MAYRKKWRVAVLAAGLTSALAMSACSAGSLGSSTEEGSGEEGAVSLTYLISNEPADVKIGEGLVAAFKAQNPNISIDLETRPGGGEGDNIVKTRLATGEMNDVFVYNTGSLLKAINPTQNLAPLTDQPWVAQTTDVFQSVVKDGNDIFGAPHGGSQAGGIMYNTKVYEELNLEVPKTWSEFMANNAKIKDAGIDPVIQTYQETWTSQLFVLGDFRNVATADPTWAEKYTANQVKYAQEPALKGFQRLEEVNKAGYLNKDYASSSLVDGLKHLADGKGAHYPILTGVIGNLEAEARTDIGFFGIPGDDPAGYGITQWMPDGVYIPKSTEGAKLDAAKKFIAFIASPEGCTAMSAAAPPAGPYVVEGCELPADAPRAVKDLQPYVDQGLSTPALEFLSPVKGPSLEQITVEVGSGLRPAADGAALYDKDVQKQAQQLGLPGW